MNTLLAVLELRDFIIIGAIVAVEFSPTVRCGKLQLHVLVDLGMAHGPEV